MALLSKIKEVKPNTIFSNFKRFYFQNHAPRLLNNYASLKPNLDYYHRFRFTNAPKNESFFPRHEGFLDSRVRFFAAPAQFVKKTTEKVRLSRPRLNDEITAEFVRLVTEEGHDVVSNWEAQRRAKELDVDLVQVDAKANPPVCKLMDYHRVRYMNHIKEKEKAKSQLRLRKSAPKEVRISAKAEHKDIKIRMDATKRLMDNGYRVKCTVMSAKGCNVGEVLSQMHALIKDVGLVESGPFVDEEKQGYFIARHIKFGLPKKGIKSSKPIAKSFGDVSEESDSDDDDEDDSDVNLKDSAEVPLQSQQEGSSSSTQPQAPNIPPAVPQPGNRYAKKAPTNAPPPVRGPVRPPYGGGTHPPLGLTRVPRQDRNTTALPSANSSQPSFMGNNSSQSPTFKPFNVNPPTSNSGGGEGSDNKKWGIFGGQNSAQGRKG